MQKADRDSSPLLKARQQGFRLLSLRARSEKELRKRLAERHGEKTADEVIRGFRAEGLLNDEAFAWERVRQLAVNRLEGNRAIEADLRERGIDRAIMGQAIAAAREELSEADAIRRLITKRKAALTETPDRAWREKTGRYLLSKGFPSGLIIAMLEEQK